MNASITHISQQMIESKTKMLRTSIRLKRSKAKLHWHMEQSTKTSNIRHKCALLLFALLLPLGACQYIQNPEPFGMYRGMEGKAPAGTPTFRYGWKNGCESGMAALGPLQYKATHDFTYDATMLTNNEYHSAWRLGFRYCRWYTGQWTKYE